MRRFTNRKCKKPAKIMVLVLEGSPLELNGPSRPEDPVRETCPSMVTLGSSKKNTTAKATQPVRNLGKVGKT